MALGEIAIMASFLDRVARIRTELLGEESSMAAAQVVAAALPLMGIVPEPSWALPQMVDAIIEKMSSGGSGSTTQAAAWAVTPTQLGDILSFPGAKFLPIFLTLGILNGGPRVYALPLGAGDGLWSSGA